MSSEVLVTAFEPFDGASSNPSMAVLELVRGGWERLERLHTAVLPVSYRRATSDLAALLAQHEPRIVVGIGLASGRRRPGLERFAINVCDARIADNDGDRPGDRPVVEGGPLAVATSLPVKSAWQALNRGGIYVELSTSAGTFVCNAVFYQAALWAEAVHRRRAGFVHVPDAGPASVSAVTAVLDAALDLERDDQCPGGSTY